MRNTIIPLATLLSAALLSPATPAVAQVNDGWEIGPNVRGRNYSVGMPARPTPGPNGTQSFDFPLAGRGEVDALTRAVGPFEGARQITLRYRIDAAPGTRFMPAETPDEPATISLYFQQAGDSWTARGRFVHYRWYVPGRAVLPITPGTHSITVRFDEMWTNVHGQPNTAHPDAYADALDDTARVGIAFGSAGRRSHGVHATGPARFTLLGLDIS